MEKLGLLWLVKNEESLVALTDCLGDKQETDVMWLAERGVPLEALNAVTLCDAIIHPRTSTDSDVRSHIGVEGGGGSDEERRYDLGDISTPQEWHLLAP
jgi:hypothetical protein